MPDVSSSYSRGLPVDPGQIDAELKKLWDAESGAATRASLINLAVYCEGADAMDAATAQIAELTRNHACRAILVATEPGAPAQRVQAWISAHCHIGGAGTAKQVCCEQITFLLEGESCGLIPNLVFSHLDSDLPLYLWWRAHFSEFLGAQLLSRVDRLIFDSKDCSAPKGRFHRLLAAIAAEKPRLILCDLNWTRTLYIRQALAQLFDHPDHLGQLAKIDSVKITHSPLHRCTAVLLAGWLAAQLNWTIGEITPGGFTFRNAGQTGKLSFVVSEGNDAAVGECSLGAGDASFRITREPGSGFLNAHVCTPDGCELHHLMPAGKADDISLLNEELALGGRHRVYLRAVEAVEKLWQASFS